MDGDSFTVYAQDPDGSFHKAPWSAPIVPAVGDTLLLPDVGGEQDVTVEHRVIRRDHIEVWVGGFDDWDDGSVRQIFEQMAAPA